MRARITEFKKVPCADCGGTFDPVCMDFDHRPGEVKTRAVSHMATTTWNVISREIAKCDVVCANCHRLRTYRKRDHRALMKRVCIGDDFDPDAQLTLWPSVNQNKLGGGK